MHSTNNKHNTLFIFSNFPFYDSKNYDKNKALAICALYYTQSALFRQQARTRGSGYNALLDFLFPPPAADGGNTYKQPFQKNVQKSTIYDILNK